MAYAIGVDVGVTNTKSVCAAEDGAVLSQQTVATEADKPDWPQRVKAHIQHLEQQRGGPARWLGIAAPGMASPDGSCIAWMQGRLGEVEGLKWSEFLGRPAPVINDAQAALLGEVWTGAARGAANAVLLTLGTGVGGALLVDGRLLRGHLGRAGHLGHISLDPGGGKDVTNTPGSLEEMIGDYTLPQRSDGRFKTTEELVARYKQGDAAAAAVWLKSIKALGAAVASLVNVADPEVVIIGGGIASAGAALFDPLAKMMDEFEWRPHGRRARIVRAALGEYAGALGAAHNAICQSREKGA
jgi:glucokinase